MCISNVDKVSFSGKQLKPLMGLELTSYIYMILESLITVPSHPLKFNNQSNWKCEQAN